MVEQDDDFKYLEIETYDETTDGDFVERFLKPYLVQLYNDLYSKEIYQTPGLNKLIFKEFAKLPGCIEDRFFIAADKDRDGFISEAEFTGIMV